MPFFRSVIDAGGRSLSPRLERLRQALDGLSARLREGVAAAIGRTVADAVHETVHGLLEGGDNPGPSQPATSTWGGHRPLHPDDDMPPTYPRQHLQPPSPLWGERSARDDDRWGDDEEIDDDRPYRQPQAPRAAPGLRLDRWMQALALGCQLAALWLRRRSGPRILLAALALGTASALAACVAGRLTLPAAGVTGSALALLTLRDLLAAFAKVLC